MNKRLAYVGFAVVPFIAYGCGSSSKSERGANDAGSSTGGGDAGAEAGPPKEAVRSSCGDMPILDDAYRNTSDACKSCFDAECCDEANACAANTKCKSYWECLATCNAPFSACADACTEAVGVAPPENTALGSCRAGCAACLDLNSCRGTTPPKPPKDSYPVTFACLSYTSAGIVFPGLTLKICDRTDVKCEHPRDEGTTADDGTVTLDLPTSPHFSDAYVEITGPNVQPTRNYLMFAAEKDFFVGHRRLIQRLLDSATASALAGVLGAKTEPASGEKAFINVAAFSCANHSVPGVTMESSGADASTVRAYVAGVAPSPTATATDGSGLAAFGDHPEGPTTITVRDADGKVHGTADIYARAGFLTGIFVPPK